MKLNQDYLKNVSINYKKMVEKNMFVEYKNYNNNYIYSLLNMKIKN